MGKRTDKVVLVTGASSGIGRACVKHLGQQGYRVYGTSRHPQDGSDASSLSNPMIQMDVNSDDSVQAGIAHLFDREGRIDVVVNNAGFVLAGAVEDISIEEAKGQFETNFFGPLRICRWVIPLMRKQGSGCIINISSLTDTLSIPFQGMYSAAKSALKAVTEALRIELMPFNIRTVVLSPGTVDTAISVHLRQAKDSQKNQRYAERLNKVLETMRLDEENGLSAAKVAGKIGRIIKNPAPRPLYRIASFSDRLVLMFKRILPADVFTKGLVHYYKIH